MSEQFSGHDLESGLLQRVRSWQEVLPPIGLIPALRVTGSPLYVGVWLATTLIVNALLTINGVPISVQSLVSIGPPGWLMIALIIAYPASMTMRAGALFSAGRDEESFIDNLKWTGARLITLFLVLALPSVCVLGLSVPLAVLGLFDRLPSMGDFVSELLALVFVPLSILIGLVMAGSIVAIPIGWASVSIEKRQDAFDALSRGYEYLYRRPVQTSIYLAVCILLAALVGSIAFGVSATGFVIARQVHSLSSGGENLPFMMSQLLFQLPIAAALCTFFSTFGAAYLLLRRDANHQEIEDVVVSEVDRRRNEMPTLKRS